MKRLNRKGFTLVELLAVIVILAIVVGITLVTILPTLESSRKKSFDVAVDAVRSYVQNQRELALLTDDLRTETYIAAIGAATCTKEAPCNGTTGSLLTVTGYAANITALEWYVENGIVKISCATADNEGDYRQSDNYTACAAAGE